MAGSINKVILVGNLGKEPDIRFSQNGAKIATFSLATSESWQDKVTNERRDNTQWHRVVVFNENLADIVEKFIKKGTKVYIEGSLQYRKYVDSNGIERNISEIVINRFRGEIQILDSKGEKSEHKEPEDKIEPTKYSEKNLANDLDDDIPF